MNWNNKNVLVTGAGGFIGSHLVDELVRRGADVTAFLHYNARNDWGMLDDRYNENDDRVSVVMGDVTDGFAVSHAIEGQDIVFHLAALIGIPYSYIAPESYINTNVMGTLNVLEACRRHDVGKIVHTSTSEVYGTAQYTPINEKHPLHGQSPYSASKIAADKIAESYYCSFSLPVATLRPFNTFGPRQSNRAVIPTIITQALTSDRISLGSLTPVRDLTYVSDTVQAFLRMAECDSAVGLTINAGNGKGITIGELAAKIVTQINPEAQIINNDERIRPEKSEVRVLVCDNSAAEEILGWKPSISLDEGLRKTVDWMKEHITSYKPGMYSV
ncbi:NAD-dependent dehydratase [Methanocalculus chunghsingensis]|uniref:NAD-dependent dehydratase n=1 Tax=Methanocalculus chunghsingensis TaxID=156457 RepID=A0A8J7W9K8_9EURY|nr:SDR family NAD(P)-dependent oxidoreductase [Methanocalculus chunghsingensis]MBR1368840.1 NAD-dependent dehydratase [Methanocalculus chunghsingensis]